MVEVCDDINCSGTDNVFCPLNKCVMFFSRGVFTPLACQFRSERIAAIGKELSKAEYDIVLLQEVYSSTHHPHPLLNYNIVVAVSLHLLEG